jgi:hypothetical protein
MQCEKKNTLTTKQFKVVFDITLTVFIIVCSTTGMTHLKFINASRGPHPQKGESKEETTQLQREYLFQPTMSSKAINSQLRQNKNSKYFPRC